jgi:hypothetical protein
MNARSICRLDGPRKDRRCKSNFSGVKLEVSQACQASSHLHCMECHVYATERSSKKSESRSSFCIISFTEAFLFLANEAVLDSLSR